jgi:DNA adenine methylase
MNDEKNHTARPPLKWAGGKRWLVPSMLPLWEPHKHRRLVEPFCGGLAVTLGLCPDRALLNDINPHLINFFHWLKAGLQIELPMRNESALFYEHRETFNRLIHNGHAQSREAAALFYYLNRTAFNGLCRFNRRGEFNVPFGKYSKINYTTDFSSYVDVFAQWQFEAGDFELLSLAPDDFIYADPPYDVEFVSYSKEGFTWDDQVRLTRWLAKHPGPVVLSNQATDRVCALYEQYGFALQFLEAPRRINSTGDRTPAPEVLALKGM